MQITEEKLMEAYDRLVSNVRVGRIDPRSLAAALETLLGEKVDVFGPSDLRYQEIVGDYLRHEARQELAR